MFRPHLSLQAKFILATKYILARGSGINTGKAPKGKNLHFRKGALIYHAEYGGNTLDENWVYREEHQKYLCAKPGWAMTPGEKEPIIGLPKRSPIYWRSYNCKECRFTRTNTTPG
jgi:hypothetical protein